MKLWTGTFLLITSMALDATTQNHYTITNGITKEMAGYEFWKTKYYPDRLAVSVNGKAIDSGTSLEIPTSDKTVSVRYDYSFAGGWRTGAKEVLLELSPGIKSYCLNFSWHDKWRIKAEGAQPKEAKRLRYKA